MLPENTFPVTGGIMQTEEVGPRGESMGIDGSLTDTSSYKHSLHLSKHLQCPVVPTLVHMAVKQEPQEDEDRNINHNLRSSSNEALNSQEVDISSTPTSTEVTHHHGNEIINQQIQPGSQINLRHSNQDNAIKSRPSRGRRKSRWKLKFHHQALPPEYLDHYEAALAQEALNSSPTHGFESTASSPTPTTSTSTSVSTPSPVADVQGWFQRISTMQPEICPRVTSSTPSDLQPGPRRSVITSTAQAHTGNHSHNNHSHNHHHRYQIPQQSTPRPPMKYSDLPYMGEITLDNSKPRRGRKPKKADICHLIYKNYGTILPGTPGHEEKKQLGKESTSKTVDNHRDNHRESNLNNVQISFQRTDIQNRISSLLEKRLTQESRKNLILTTTTSSSSVSPSLSADNTTNREQDEPLNLCIKDLNQLKIHLLRKNDNQCDIGVKSETSSDVDEEIECLGTPIIDSNNSQSQSDYLDSLTNNNNNLNVVNNNTKNIDGSELNQNNPGYVYWSNAGVFIHPMALQSQFMYYQKISQNNNNNNSTNNNNNNSTKNSSSPVDENPQSKEQKIVPKSIYTMLDNKNVNNQTSASSPSSSVATTPTVTTTASGNVNLGAPVSPRPKRIAPLGQPPSQPTKRKRSAIFIPPMPSENNNNPATEVSICKFKFTGGAKPSLQEKKSLSVDSGGNFRYYSGTGDKSMRGYEFFPRESLQQPAGQAGSSTGAFLNAAGERIQPSQCQRIGNQDDGRKKRKTRKSLQREKLEQTFKEKGFLIQTQQLESAEGATYCKFRQLRKFTRYLFRSWKDHLPGNVGEMLTNNQIDCEAIDNDLIERDHTESPTLSPIIDIQNNSVIEDHRTLT